MIPKIVILMGPPGSGKGTQAKLFANLLGYTHISTGSLLRDILNNPEADAEIKSEATKILQGSLVADWLIYKLVFPLIEEKIKSGTGVILDGAIRNLSQAEEYGKFFTDKDFWGEVKAIWIDLNEEVSLDRLITRRECSSCRDIIPYTAETKDLITCPKCGGFLEKRSDDKEMAIFKKRLEGQGRVAQEPIIEYFKEKNVLVEVDGSKDISVVTEEIKNILEIK